MNPRSMAAATILVPLVAGCAQPLTFYRADGSPPEDHKFRIDKSDCIAEAGPPATPAPSVNVNVDADDNGSSAAGGMAAGLSSGMATGMQLGHLAAHRNYREQIFIGCMYERGWTLEEPQ